MKKFLSLLIVLCMALNFCSLHIYAESEDCPCKNTQTQICAQLSNACLDAILNRCKANASECADANCVKNFGVSDCQNNCLSGIIKNFDNCKVFDNASVCKRICIENGRIVVKDFDCCSNCNNNCGQEQPPEAKPTAQPVATAAPTAKPVATAKPTAKPTAQPVATAKPTAAPTAVPTAKPTAQPTAAPTAKPQDNGQFSKEQQEVLELVNKYRRQNGLSEVVLDKNLSTVAYMHSKDMAQNNFFSHTNLKGESPFDRIKNFGISYRAAGENIAAGQRTPEEVMNSWMNSDGHRANILTKNYNKMGVGIYYGGSYGVYWTQNFTD